MQRGAALALASMALVWVLLRAPGSAQEPNPKDAMERAGATPQSAARGAPNEPKVEDLGNQRYRIGHIEVDKTAQRFTVPGVILRREPPLEFLAVSKGGAKGYESLLELDASAYEFNLACIFIGLDPARGKVARHHFDPEPTQGDGLEMHVSWTMDGKNTEVDGADLVRAGETTLARSEWVYTGSAFTPDRRYLAELDGTVIGFVHDPSSIVEHRHGFLGKYGDAAPNTTLVPPVGTPVTLSVWHPSKSKQPQEAGGAAQKH